jgi:hypothetical protein
VNRIGEKICQSGLLDLEKHAIGISGFQNGIYFVKVRDKRNEVTRKIVVQ